MVNASSNVLHHLPIYNQVADEHFGKMMDLWWNFSNDFSKIGSTTICTSKILRTVLWYGNERLMEILKKKKKDKWHCKNTRKLGRWGEINWTYTFDKYLFFAEEKCTVVWAVIMLTYILFFILLVIHNVVVYIQK